MVALRLASLRDKQEATNKKVKQDQASGQFSLSLPFLGGLYFLVGRSLAGAQSNARARALCQIPTC